MKKPVASATSPDPDTKSSPDISATLNDVMLLPEAAAFLRCDPKTVLKMAKDGTISYRRVGTGWRFSRKLLTKWMQEEKGSGDTKGGAA
jgi:excisionase family DNA binding protein